MLKARTGLAGKAMFGACAALLAVAVPTAGFAFGNFGAEDTQNPREQFLAFTPADADPRLARLVAERSGEARMMRFTPASVGSSPASRSITVAVRVDQDLADVLGGNSTLGSGADKRPTALRVTPTRYNLGLARGYASFAQDDTPAAPALAPTISSTLSNADIPDIRDFGDRRSGRDEPSRFAARIALDEDARADVAAGDGETLTDQLLDVGGSYSLTRNLDITAGVRYEQDRDLVPVPNLDQQDSQAVYIGTQFRF